MCDDYAYHRQEGRDDYRRGYKDHSRYGNHYNECDLAYTKGFDNARRDERERREMREEEDSRMYQEQEEEYQRQLYYNQLADEENEKYLRDKKQAEDELPF